MSEGEAPPPDSALLARKGGATASGFEGAAELARPAPPPAKAVLPRVLIVEDNVLSMKMMTDLFEGNGYRALPAVNGPQALATARAEHPELILMDIGLPGLSGLEITRRIKADAALKGVPVVAVSARTSPEDEAAARRAGCDDFLAKPVSVSRMLSTAAKFVS